MMGKDRFGKGVQAVLNTHWKLRLETPLCIKNGSKSAFKAAGGNKTRHTSMTFKWNQGKGKDEVEVSEFCFGLRVMNGKAEPCYHIPASSVRGALRSWTLTRLVKASYRKLLNATEDSKEQTKQVQEASKCGAGEGATIARKLKNAIQDDPFLALVADCFGVVAGETDEHEETLSQTGKLKVGVQPLEEASEKPWVQGEDWEQNGNRFGPSNAIRHLTVRGPVDRITHGAKEGGLHYFMEFSPGLCFDMDMKIVNPEPIHLGLVGIWEREINDGILRLGGLTSVGRGRLSVRESESQLYSVSSFELKTYFKGLKAQKIKHDEIYSDIWKCHSIPDMSAYIAELAEINKE